jgi:hypothetical protein
VARSQPDIVVDLGDRISEKNADEDRRNLEAVASRFNAIDVPRFHLIGNHDVMCLDRQDNEDVLQRSVDHQVHEIKGWRLVFWQARVAMDRMIAMHDPSSDDLAWLEYALIGHRKPTVVFSHAPVSGHSMIGIRYFEHNADLATYPNHKDIRRLVDKAGAPVLWVSGHVHWNSIMNVRGVHHLTVQSLSECYPDARFPSGAYADLELTDKAIDVTVHGRDLFKLRVGIPDWGTASRPDPIPAFTPDPSHGGIGSDPGGGVWRKTPIAIV